MTMLDHWDQGAEAVDQVLSRGDQLLAQNILDGKSSTFDLANGDRIKEKRT